MIYIDLEQGSKEWHRFRQCRIGASDAATILGMNPYKTRYQLWQQKMGLLPPEPENDAMRKGKELEPEARAKFEEVWKVKVYPKIVVNPTYDWMFASLDGISDDEKTLVEIKCPGLKTHRIAESGEVPELYKPQCYHQMLCTGLNGMFYFSYYNKNYHSLNIYQNDKEFIDWMIEEENKFYKCMINFEYK